MGSVESLLIGGQAKKLREEAALTVNEITEVVPSLNSADLKAFENGELHSSDVIHSIFQMYFQAIEVQYLKQGRSFLKFIEEYCLKNELDYQALINSYYSSVADVVVNRSNKEEIVKNMSSYMFGMNSYKDFCLTLQKNTEHLLKQTNKLIETSEWYHDRYLETHHSYTKSSSKAEILIQIISGSDYKEGVLESIRENMELEREEDFPEHSEETYNELIHEIETYWDFLNKGEM